MLFEFSLLSFTHSFIPDIYIVYIAPFKETYSEALSVQLRPTRNICKKLAEGRHVVRGQQAECKREFIPSGGANNRESSTLFKRRAGPRNQKLTTSRRTKTRTRPLASCSFLTHRHLHVVWSFLS